MAIKIIRVLLTLLAALTVMLAAATQSKADIGNFGPGPAPGLCDYPAVCNSGYAGGIVDYYFHSEDWPIESNGTHRHCVYYGVATQGHINVGFQFYVTAEVGGEGPVGAMIGGCNYVCPSGELGEFPNPPGSWRDALIPRKCQPIGPNPDHPPALENVPIAPPIPAQGAVAPPPPTILIPPGPDTFQPFADLPGFTAPPPPLADMSPAQTFPVCGNPAAASSAGCQ